MTTFWAAGIVLGVAPEPAGRRGGRGRRRRRLTAAVAHDDLPERVAVRRRPLGHVDAQVTPGAADVERLGAAGAGRGAVDGGPAGSVGGELDLERPGVRRLPGQHDLADLLGGAEVDLDPLWITERARPAGAGVAVDRVRGAGGGCLGGRRARRAALRDVGAAAAGAAADDAVDAELPERIAVRRAARGAVHPHVPAAARDGEGLGAAGAGRGAVDGGPAGSVGRGLDLERTAVRGLPAEGDLVDRGGLAEVDLDPLWITERARPAGAGIAVDGVRGGHGRVLGGRRGGRAALGDQRAGGLGAARGDHDEADQGERERGDGRGDGDRTAAGDGRCHGTS